MRNDCEEGAFWISTDFSFSLNDNRIKMFNLFNSFLAQVHNFSIKFSEAERLSKISSREQFYKIN